MLKSPNLEGDKLTFDIEVLEGDLNGADGAAAVFIESSAGHLRRCPSLALRAAPRSAGRCMQAQPGQQQRPIARTAIRHRPAATPLSALLLDKNTIDVSESLYESQQQNFFGRMFSRSWLRFDICPAGHRHARLARRDNDNRR